MGCKWSIPALLCEAHLYEISDPVLLVDKNDRVIAVLVGRPEHDGYVVNATKVVEMNRRARRAAGFTKSQLGKDRRGHYEKIHRGYSHGGGRKVHPITTWLSSNV